jgi:hypothetical protein
MLLTDDHDGKVEALLDGLAVNLVGQVGETHISLELLAKSAANQRLLRQNRLLLIGRVLAV